MSSKKKQTKILKLPPSPLTFANSLKSVGKPATVLGSIKHMKPTKRK